MRYTAWGETRYAWGSTPTDHRYTGQRQDTDIGLSYYRARWYDPALGRFAQADTIVPGGGSGTWDRYAYGLANPVRYTDPTGHWADEGCGYSSVCNLPAPGNDQDLGDEGEDPDESITPPEPNALTFVAGFIAFGGGIGVVGIGVYFVDHAIAACGAAAVGGAPEACLLAIPHALIGAGIAAGGIVIMISGVSAMVTGDFVAWVPEYWRVWDD